MRIFTPFLRKNHITRYNHWCYDLECSGQKNIIYVRTYSKKSRNSLLGIIYILIEERKDYSIENSLKKAPWPCALFASIFSYTGWPRRSHQWTHHQHKRTTLTNGDNATIDFPALRHGAIHNDDDSNNAVNCLSCSSSAKSESGVKNSSCRCTERGHLYRAAKYTALFRWKRDDDWYSSPGLL